MNVSKTAKELKAEAKERGIRGYSRMRKAELVTVLSNILNEPVPYINVPVIKPIPKTFKPSSLRSLAERAVFFCESEINKFADWILSYVPEPIKKVIDERVELLKDEVRVFSPLSLINSHHPRSRF